MLVGEDEIRSMLPCWTSLHIIFTRTCDQTEERRPTTEKESLHFLCCTDTDDVIHPLKTPVHSRYIMRRVMRMRFHDVIFAVPFTPVRKQMRFNYLKGARACA